MNHLSDEDHGPTLCLARSEVGGVAMCGCGVLTVTLQYLSLRFEPDAFRELAALLAQAQAKLDGNSARRAQQAPRSDEESDIATSQALSVH
ncbi:MAG TPA: hypothetical protein VKI18_02685 [Albitalea sp.]|nr:hypothetical protein [Albitalea sp.]